MPRAQLSTASRSLLMSGGADRPSQVLPECPTHSVTGGNHVGVLRAPLSRSPVPSAAGARMPHEQESSSFQALMTPEPHTQDQNAHVRMCTCKGIHRAECFTAWPCDLV